MSAPSRAKNYRDYAQIKQQMAWELRLNKEKVATPSPITDSEARKRVAPDEAYKERIQSGIPLHPEVIDWFRDICTELEVPFPMGV